MYAYISDNGRPEHYSTYSYQKGMTNPSLIFLQWLTELTGAEEKNADIAFSQFSKTLKKCYDNAFTMFNLENF